MNCTKCNTENLDSAKFCKKCGHDLSKKEVKQVKRKRSVKISGGKIKFAIIAIVIIVLIGAGAMSLKKKSDEKRILSSEYLDEFFTKKMEEDCKVYSDISSHGGNSMKDGEIDAGIESCAKIMKEFIEIGEIYIAHARESEFNENSEIEEFIKIDDFFPAVDNEKLKEMTTDIKDLKLFLRDNNNKFDKLGLNTKQSEKFIAIMEDSFSAAKLFNVIKIEKETEQIIADYTEQENDKIPAGYSIITAEPQNGEKESVTIIVDGEEKGSGEIVSKEPQNGVKMIGSGNTEDIAKQAEDKLNQILELWREQNFTAATILPFLPEGSESKAPEWESAYKKIIFNWRRFDKVEPILGQANFKEYNNASYPFLINLPVTVSYYAGNGTPTIPLYYSAKKDEWVSGNSTFVKLFEIIKYQSIEAEISPKSFKFPDSEACTSRRYFQGNKEVEVESAKVTRSDDFYIDFSASLGDLSLSSDGFTGDVVVKRGSSIPLALVDHINNTKNIVLLGKSFKYRSYPDCRIDNTNILFTFFK